MEKKKWFSSQAIIVMTIIAVIFIYIAVDVFYTKPQMNKALIEVKGQYVELADYLDEKIPEIDSTFREHATQIETQRQEIDVLQETLSPN